MSEGVKARVSALLFPLLSGLLLAFACYFLRSRLVSVHHVGDFGSHTLYQTFIGLTAVLLLWQAFRQARRHLLWWPPAVALACGGAVEALKRLTRLPRPDGDPSGFPSGHTTFAFALAWLLARTYPRLAPLWYAVAVVIGWSRVEGNAHFPYQVLWGAALGTALGGLVSRVFRAKA